MRFSLTTLLYAFFLIATLMGLVFYDNSEVLHSLPFSSNRIPQVTKDGKLAYYQNEKGNCIIYHLQEKREILNISSEPADTTLELRISADQKWLRLQTSPPLYADIVAQKFDDSKEIEKNSAFEVETRLQSEDGQIIVGIRPDRLLVYRKAHWSYVQSILTSLFVFFFITLTWPNKKPAELNT